MTELEAANEILMGPYSLCLKCGGRGRVPGKLTRIGDDSDGADLVRDAFDTLTCLSCSGTGHWLRGDYKIACVMLEMDIPMSPSRWQALHKKRLRDAAKIPNFGRNL